MEGHFPCTCTRDRGKDCPWGTVPEWPHTATQRRGVLILKTQKELGRTHSQKGGISYRHSWAQTHE